MDQKLGKEIRAWARVVGVVSPGTIDVFVAPGVGLADGGIPHKIPLDMVLADLRMPNSEFFLLLDRQTGAWTRVERCEEIK